MKKQKGVVLAFALVILGILLLLVGALYGFLQSDYSMTTYYLQKEKTLSLAEAGIDKAIMQLKSNPSYAGETTSLQDGDFIVTVTDIGGNKKRLEAKGCYPSAANCKYHRSVRTQVTTTSSPTSIAFHYAVQIGDMGLTMYSNAQIKGNVYSNGNVTGYSNSKITGDTYAVGTISSPAPQISGTKNPGAPTQPLPSLDFNFWKTGANINNDQINGNYELNGNCPAQIPTLGPRKITGYFKMNSNTCLKITGPLYVQGNFEMNSNSKLYLDESFGSSGTVIVIDGTIKLNSNSYIYSTSASPKGYIILATENSGTPAVELNSNSSNSIIYAPNGEVQINSNGKVVEVAAKKLTLNSNATLDYDQGLASATFTSGPGGTFSIIPGTWTEVK